MHRAVEEMIARFDVNDETRRFLAKRKQMFVGGAFTDGAAAARIETREPSTGEVLDDIPAGVEQDVDAAVQAARAAVARGMKLRPGLDPECDMGPVISAEQQRSILNYIDKGRAEGATIVCGGKAHGGKGYFVEPTLMTARDNRLTVVQEEIFGPALVVLPFDDEEDAVRLANDNAYGLGASVWTRDVSRALRVGRALKAGSVWVNAHDLVDSAIPFGGAKASGFGKDMGREQFDACLRTKSMWITL